MNKKEERCGNCYYRVEDKCRRNSPKPTIIHADIMRILAWPTIECNEWCGDWKENPNE